MPWWVVGYLVFLGVGAVFGAAYQHRRGVSPLLIAGDLVASAGTMVLSAGYWLPWLQAVVGRGVVPLAILVLAWTVPSTARQFALLRSDPALGEFGARQPDPISLLLTALGYAPAGALTALWIQAMRT
ncbi:MAG: hypothetical protein ACOY71_03160 [Gemmatimonadota bacterium]